MCLDLMLDKTVLPLCVEVSQTHCCLCCLLDIATSKFSDGGCKLSLLQKDLKLAINMSDAVDQPLHVSSAVNEVTAYQECGVLFLWDSDCD